MMCSQPFTHPTLAWTLVHAPSCLQLEGKHLWSMPRWVWCCLHACHQWACSLVGWMCVAHIHMPSRANLLLCWHHIETPWHPMGSRCLHLLTHWVCHVGFNVCIAHTLMCAQHMSATCCTHMCCTHINGCTFSCACDWVLALSVSTCSCTWHPIVCLHTIECVMHMNMGSCFAMGLDVLAHPIGCKS